MNATMSQPTTIGERLRELRKERGLTLAALAEKSGIHLQSIARIESGVRPNPSWETVLAIADALEVSCEELRTRAEPPPPPKRRGKK